MYGREVLLWEQFGYRNILVILQPSIPVWKGARVLLHCVFGQRVVDYFTGFSKLDEGSEC